MQPPGERSRPFPPGRGAKSHLTFQEPAPGLREGSSWHTPTLERGLLLLWQSHPQVTLLLPPSAVSFLRTMSFQASFKLKRFNGIRTSFKNILKFKPHRVDSRAESTLVLPCTGSLRTGTVSVSHSPLLSVLSSRLLSLFNSPFSNPPILPLLLGIKWMISPD